MKTAERAHTPKDLWEAIKLNPSYNKALEQIDTQLQYWPNFLKHKCKQRFTRIRQVLVKKKKMKLEGMEEYEVISRKAEKREKRRLVKAEKSAVIENHITEELLKNLKTGKYNQIYNYPNKVLDHIIEKEYIVDSNKDEEFNDEDYDHGYIEDFSDEDDYEENEVDDDDDDETNKHKGDDEDGIEYDDIFNTSNNKTRDSHRGKSDKKAYQNKKRKRPIKYEVEREYEESNNKKNFNNQLDY